MNHLSLLHAFEKIEKGNKNAIGNRKRAKVGSYLQLLEKETLTISRISLCLPEDSNPSLGKISCLSILGSALLDTEAGETVSVNVLGRYIKFQVLSIKNKSDTKLVVF